MQGGSFLQ
jgi:hypothetical protein